jgi:hypothetical protein
MALEGHMMSYIYMHICLAFLHSESKLQCPQTAGESYIYYLEWFGSGLAVQTSKASDMYDFLMWLVYTTTLNAYFILAPFIRQFFI